MASSGHINNLQVNYLLTNNLLVNDITKQKNDIVEILKSGLYRCIDTYSNGTVKEKTLFIIHNLNKNYNFIKYYILDNNTIIISNFTINNNNVIINSTISQKNGIIHNRQSKIISTNNNSIKIKYSGYKYYTKIFHENCDAEINLTNYGFEIIIYDENHNFINKSEYTKLD